MSDNITTVPENEEQELNEQQLSELLQIRRDKLLALQKAGNDPFTVTVWSRCG